MKWFVYDNKHEYSTFNYDLLGHYFEIVQNFVFEIFHRMIGSDGIALFKIYHFTWNVLYL